MRIETRDGARGQDGWGHTHTRCGSALVCVPLRPCLLALFFVSPRWTGLSVHRFMAFAKATTIYRIPTLISEGTAVALCQLQGQWPKQHSHASNSESFVLLQKKAVVYQPNEVLIRRDYIRGPVLSISALQDL